VEDTVALLVIACAGVAFVLGSLRGVATDGHPTCRRCGYDLVRLHPCPSRCPECGRPLRTWFGIRYGHRRVRRGPLAAGSLLLLIAGVMGVSALVRCVHNNGWWPFIPDWVLEGQVMDDARPQRAARCLKELAGRIKGRIVAKERVSRLVARALEEQASASTAWVVEWGNVVDAARSIGQVDDSSLRMYARNSLPLTTVVTRDSDGTPIIGLGVGPMRVGQAPGLRVLTQIERIRMDAVVGDPIRQSIEFWEEGDTSTGATVQELPWGYGKRQMDLEVIWHTRVFDSNGALIDEWSATPGVTMPGR
jgi:hypothetical protein